MPLQVCVIDQSGHYSKRMTIVPDPSGHTHNN